MIKKSLRAYITGGVYVLLGSQTCERKRVRCGECAAASRSLFKREPNEVGLV